MTYSFIQITLRLPIDDNRPRFGSIDDIFAGDDESKELKQSDSHAQSRRTAHVTSDKPYGYKSSSIVNNKTTTTRLNQKPQQTYNVYAQQSPINTDYTNQNYQQRHTDNVHSQSNHETNSNYDKVLLTPQ